MSGWVSEWVSEIARKWLSARENGESVTEEGHATRKCVSK